MRKSLLALTVVALSSSSFAGEFLDQEILNRLKELEAKVQRLEKENRELRSLLLKKEGVISPARKRDKKLKVGGRVLFRFSQTQDLDEAGGKSIYGDPSNGFTIRKARLFVSGDVDDDFKYKVQIRADRGAPVELWDAYITYSPSYLPVSIKVGQFKVPLSMSYLKSGTQLLLPERPLAVNKIAPVWRDLGLSFTYKFFDRYSLTGAILNGEGWTSKNKISNSDRKYAYVIALEGKPVDTPSYSLKFRVGYETGRDSSTKVIYKKYGASSVKRHLLDVEGSLKIKSYSLTFEGGYLFDNPTDPKGNVSLGNAKGYYIQADYALPFDTKLHLVGRYSWLDPNDDVDDKYDLSYTTIGAYYLIHGWQAALRTSYTFANQRETEEVDDNLFTAELQLLF